MRLVLYIVGLFLFISCQKTEVGTVETPFSTSQRTIDSYEDAFVETFGEYYYPHRWGHWMLMQSKGTREPGYFNPVEVPEDDIQKVLNLLRNKYDGINTTIVPSGSYFAKIVFRNDYIYYNEPTYLIDWFTASEKIGDIKKYNYKDKIYETIEFNDSLTFIKDIGIYDNVMPQLAYYNDLFGENHYEYIVLENKGIYYVGFDFYADGYIELDDKNRISVVNERDLIYNDVVLMLIPADKHGSEEVIDEKRVICEDMCDYDFDFNDVVFDVALVKLEGRIQTRIKFVSVGTINPMSVFGYEAHAVFGEQTTTMINSVGLEVGVKRDPVYVYADTIIDNIKDITVASFKDKTLLMITANFGEAPRKICVGKDFRWCSGKRKISDVYPLFKEWLLDEKVVWENDYDENLVSK